MEKSFGDCITTTDYNQYKNILVLHSYHYHWPVNLTSRQRRYRDMDPKVVCKPKEYFEREIGLELEKMNLPNVIVKESPRVRKYRKLLDSYKARFVLDLHDINRGYDSRLDQPYYIAHIYHVHNRKLDEYFERFRKEKRLRYDIKGALGSVDNYGAVYRNHNPRSLGIELFPWAGKEKSLESLKRLTDFLKQNDLNL